MGLIFTLCVCGVGHIYIAQLESCSLFMKWSGKQGRGIFSGERSDKQESCPLHQFKNLDFCSILSDWFPLFISLTCILVIQGREIMMLGLTGGESCLTIQQWRFDVPVRGISSVLCVESCVWLIVYGPERKRYKWFSKWYWLLNAITTSLATSLQPLLQSLLCCAILFHSTPPDSYTNGVFPNPRTRRGV
jgi:hypothetical protein